MIDGVGLLLLGTAASILILAGWVEQIYKGYKTKKLKDVSKFLMIFISAGAVLWLVYGLIVEDIFITGTNITAIILMTTVLFMKRKYDRQYKERQLKNSK